MRNSYNYTIAIEHERKLRIPFLNIELKGWFSLLVFFIGVVLIVGTVFGVMRLFLETMSAFFISLFIAMFIAIVINTSLQSKNDDSGEYVLVDAFYRYVKRYRVLYDEDNRKQYYRRKHREKVFICIHH